MIAAEVLILPTVVLLLALPVGVFVLLSLRPKRGY